MKITPAASAAVGFLLLVALALQAGPAKAQNNPAAGGRTGVLNLRDCMDKARNPWIAEIEAEVQKVQEAEAGRATDLNPQERARIRAKIQDLSNKRKLEVYSEIVRLSGEIAQARGFDLVQRLDRMPGAEGGDTDLTAQMDRRDVLYSHPSVDITAEVLERLNKDHAAKKK
jgi:Skp family chaperone for outer membrane proteins